MERRIGTEREQSVNMAVPPRHDATTKAVAPHRARRYGTCGSARAPSGSRDNSDFHHRYRPGCAESNATAAGLFPKDWGGDSMALRSGRISHSLASTERDPFSGETLAAVVLEVKVTDPSHELKDNLVVPVINTDLVDVIGSSTTLLRYTSTSGGFLEANEPTFDIDVIVKGVAVPKWINFKIIWGSIDPPTWSMVEEDYFIEFVVDFKVKQGAATEKSQVTKFSREAEYVSLALGVPIHEGDWYEWIVSPIEAPGFSFTSRVKRKAP